MKPINKPILNSLRADMNAALAAVAKKHGYNITVGNCKFNTDIATYKLEVTQISESGEVMTQEKRELAQWSSLNSVTAEMLKTPVRLGGRDFLITGYLYSRYAKPFMLTATDGDKGKYVGRADQVLPQLAKLHNLPNINPVRFQDEGTRL